MDSTQDRSGAFGSTEPSDRRSDAQWNQDVDTKMAGFARAASERLGRVGAVLQGAATQARDKMNSYREAGLQQVKDDVTRYAESNPAIALAVALGAGVLIGMLLMRGRE